MTPVRHGARAVGAVVLTALIGALLPVLVPSPPASAATAYRVLITGDSITQGSSGDYTWRYRLWSKLAGTAPGATLVGGRTDLYDNVNAKQGSQHYAASFTGKAHSALWGDSYRDELGSIASQVTSSRANVLVVMLGSNDLTYFTNPEQTIANVRTYITRARAAAPGIDVVVGQVLEKWDPWAGEYQLRPQVSEYATRLAALAADLDTSAQRVVVARTRDGWDPRTLAWDGTHPNASGEALIAQRVSEALAKIGVGTAGPDVSGETKWTVPGPAPTLTGGSETALVRWNRTSTGATGMYLEQRLVNGDGAWQRLPYAVSADQFTAELLAAGGTYQFRLVPVKGFSTGVAGPAASVSVSGPTPGAIDEVDPRATGTAAQGGQKVRATWAASANAQGYLLSLRLMQDAQPAWDDLPYPVTERAWTFEPLYQGRRYQIRVRGSRGFLTGPWKGSPTVRTRLFPGNFVHAALGDSYSSGLGADGAYTGGSCARADEAWPYSVHALFRVGIAHLACAGGKVPDVRGQLAGMNTFFAKHPDRPQLVTLTVGGNDVGFSNTLQACVVGDCSRDEPTLHNRIAAAGDALVKLYKDIRAAHPYADVLVGGYPNVLERSGGSFNPLCLRIHDDEREMVDRLVSHLNNEIAEAAAGARVWTVGQRLQEEFRGHNACAGGSAEWVHAGNLDIGGEAGLVDRKSFHPNGTGQYHVAEVFNRVWDELSG